MTGVLEFDVVGVHQLRGRDVDQPMAKDVGTQQYLALAALEPAQVHLVLRQHHPVPVEVLDPFDRNVHSPTTDIDYQPGYRRVGVHAEQSHDQIV